MSSIPTPGEGHFQIAMVAQGFLREKLRKKVRSKGEIPDVKRWYL
jgi:hypothetical protein